MTYAPGPARGARIQKDGDAWTLVLVRDLRHPPARVWKALTDPEQLRAWAPFDSDRPLDALGPANLSTVGTPTPYVSPTQVKRVEPFKALEYGWGGGEMRWELEPIGTTGTRLTLWHNINKGFIAMGAAGWHICFDVLDRQLGGEAIERIAGPSAMKVEGWSQLLADYAKHLGVEPPTWKEKG